MSNIEIGNLVYLLLLGAVLLSWAFVQNRRNLGRLAQQAIAWGLIFLGTIAAIGLWDDIRGTVQPSLATVTEGNRVEVPRARDGHYYLTLEVNGTPVRFMIDTGASQVVLTRRDAERVGIAPGDLAYSGRANTANGTVRTAPVVLDDIALGPIRDRGVPAAVNEGEMDESLLGMSYLQRWGRIEIGGGALVLTR
ncbi:retropepsin-like aspartic protease family protein [Pukyongiella litopenaei]|uniref:TIGR02281 family clan AA aspartic protease n=1 Tax=Pukyongiella litopenaei TaxID=2605946 RepID=A0A2S0MUK9_9RHOB|nr:TIGR02281 family clan AA aspartic protease [Pukyongiella litopenaei]AVO39383.1 TIGR02281 family clan AA aspartic protease [Pukyongiella litopenaei]